MEPVILDKDALSSILLSDNTKGVYSSFNKSPEETATEGSENPPSGGAGDWKYQSSILLSDNIEDYPDGIIIPIDKPYRWTSADVIRKIKYAATRHFGKKNLKVGHAGTLDPLATGVLLVCIGKATKLAETLQAHDKEYIAEVVFGATTPSYDLEKGIDRHFPYGHITESAVSEALKGFLGEQEQVAPLFSAKSVDGVRAYELARKLFIEQTAAHTSDMQGAGRQECHDAEFLQKENRQSAFDQAAESIIRTARINITAMELLDFKEAMPMEGNEHGSHHTTQHSGTEYKEDNVLSLKPDGTGFRNHGKNASSRINVTDNSALGLPSATIRIACSKGTYIRAIARDLGEALGSGAHLGALQRSRSGDFHVNSALTVGQAIAALEHPRT